MKTIFKFLTLAMLLGVFSAATVTTAFGQDEAADKLKLYTTYTDNYTGDIAKRQVALDAAKSYVEKYGAKPEDKEQVDYFKSAIPDLEKGITAEKAATAKAAAAKADAAVKQAGYAAFNTATTAKNTANIYTAGKDVLSREPDYLDVIIVLANAGFDEVLKDPKSQYNADVVNYATTAIQKINAGKESESKSYGALTYSLGDKNNALRILNYIAGYTTFVNMGKKQEALPYFYQSSKLEVPGKAAIPLMHQAVGSYYLDEAIKRNGVRLDKIKEAGDKDTPETLAMLAEQRGYADRAIDGYARAYKLAKDDPKQTKEYRDSLYNKLKELYTFRYDNNDGIDAFVASVQSKPLPDPSAPIVPVPVETTTPTGTTPANGTTPTVTPTPTTGTTPTVKPATTTPAVKSVTTPTVKPATTTPMVKPTVTPKPATTPTANADKTDVKKVAPKKKGTR